MFLTKTLSNGGCKTIRYEMKQINQYLIHNICTRFALEYNVKSNKKA